MNKNQWQYIVWVGGVDDYYTTYATAKDHYDKWIERGFDDVILQCWDTFHKKYRTICYTENLKEKEDQEQVLAEMKEIKE